MPLKPLITAAPKTDAAKVSDADLEKAVASEYSFSPTTAALLGFPDARVSDIQRVRQAAMEEQERRSSLFLDAQAGAG